VLQSKLHSSQFHFRKKNTYPINLFYKFGFFGIIIHLMVTGTVRNAVPVKDLVPECRSGKSFKVNSTRSKISSFTRHLKSIKNYNAYLG